MSSPPTSGVFDTSAILTFGAGLSILSGVVLRTVQHGERMILPAIALADAERQRPGAGRHVAAMPDHFDVEDLTPAGALAVGALVRGGLDWSSAHAVYTASPAIGWEAGRTILSINAKPYIGLGVATWTIPTDHFDSPS